MFTEPSKTGPNQPRTCLTRRDRIEDNSAVLKARVRKLSELITCDRDGNTHKGQVCSHVGLEFRFISVLQILFPDIESLA